MSESFSAVARVYLAGAHLETASFLARQAKTFEEAQSCEPSREVMFCAIGAVQSSVAFLEAQVNSIYVDNASGVGEKRRLFAAVEQDILKKLWPLVERASALEKYQVILQFVRHREIDRGTAVWDAASALVYLRNALVHFKPESVTLASSIDERTSNQLSVESRLSRRFAPNPWFSETATVFYVSHLSYGCAAWAVNTALDLSDAFFKVLGVEAPYDNDRGRFATA